MTIQKYFSVLSLGLLCMFITEAEADSAKLFNPTNNHIYQRIDVSFNWATAKNSCAEKGGYLATITSQAENDWIKNNHLASSSGGTIIGSICSGKLCEWVTGEMWSYSNFPSSHEYYEIYTVVTATGEWYQYSYDYDGGDSYLCEWDKPFKTYSDIMTADTDNNGSLEFVLIGNDGKNVKVFSYDIATNAKVSDINFASYTAYSGVNVSILDDMNNNGYKEIALLMNKKTDDSSVIQIRDSKTGKLIKSYNPSK
jgi:hypothetical protein